MNDSFFDHVSYCNSVFPNYNNNIKISMFDKNKF